VGSRLGLASVLKCTGRYQEWWIQMVEQVKCLLWMCIVYVNDVSFGKDFYSVMFCSVISTGYLW